MKQYFIIGLLALSVVACKKTQPRVITAPPAKGRITFLQEEMEVRVSPENPIVTVPLRLTRRDRSKSLTANVSVYETRTTAVLGKHFQLFSVTENDRFDKHFAVAEFAPGDSLALFPILLSPEQITEPMTISLALLDTYHPEYMDEKIHFLDIQLIPQETATGTDD